MSKHTPDILFTTMCPSAYGAARRHIATALAERLHHTYFGGTNLTHARTEDRLPSNRIARV